MEKSMIEKELSMGKFLFLFFGIDINKAANITHKDVRRLFPYLEPVNDYDFWYKCEHKVCDYVRVKDKNNLVLYYNKVDLGKNLEIIDYGEKDNQLKDVIVMDDFIASETKQINELLEFFDEIDLSQMTKYELCELERRIKKMKKIVGYKRNLITKNVAQVQKQLRKIKKQEKEGD